MTALSSLVDRLVTDTNADIVFFDAGPNIGPMNRALLLDCTHFIVPAACDLFSSRALKTLGYALSDWIETRQQDIERAPDGTRLLPVMPRQQKKKPQKNHNNNKQKTKTPHTTHDSLE